MENFEDASQLLLGNGGIQVTSPAQLSNTLLTLLRNPKYREQLGQKAAAQILNIRGTAKLNASHIINHAFRKTKSKPSNAQ